MWFWTEFLAVVGGDGARRHRRAVAVDGDRPDDAHTPAGLLSARQSISCITATSSQWLNLRPTSRSTPTSSKPQAAWS